MCTAAAPTALGTKTPRASPIPPEEVSRLEMERLVAATVKYDP
ncbi:hypothetical protein PC128_g7055 [Phytophthora cactorum]|nr:hypothetical protein PC120_g7131 [Phytophthora cactorum]KAG3197170.1 hypothetical protein PC128_g7055 [Phytophthora cactorum]KAG4053999.1 hypothetical protein PC123_g10863 [Phytophthora cactorum]